MRSDMRRRDFLRRSAGLLGALPLVGIAPDRLRAQLGLPATTLDDDLRPKAPHFAPRAKAVIFLFMYGGPSQVDTFDYKPDLYGLDGKTIKVTTRGRGGSKNEGRIVGPKWSFKPYGECGKMVSDLFPNVGRHVDDIAFLHSMYADSPIHGSAMLMMNSGRLLSGHPAMGSWATYGLGSQNPNMPGYVVMLDPTGGPISGAKNWSSGYMPAGYQGVVLRSKGSPILHLDLPEGMTRARQRRLLDHLKRVNERHFVDRSDNSELAARIAGYELAYRMEAYAPNLLDLGTETDETRALYGVDREKTDDFGRKCLLARRLVESGVRFVQIYSGGHHDDNNWDAHGDLKVNHDKHAGATDLPIAGLIADLKRRGLFDETLIVWGGEFGRQPTAEYAEGTGRDHNSYGFTMWMAGGGIPGGVSLGKTDELGSAAVESRFHVKHLHATILHQLGFDPNELTYRYAGLDQKLVGVEGAYPIDALV